MSHVAVIKLELKNLEALKTACKNLGLKFNEGQKKYNWYGRSVGDYALPNGYEAKDLGK